MIRFEDWPKRLNDFTQGALERPFCWGSWDCALAAAGCVEAITGIDFAAEYRGYDSKRGAYAALKRIAGGGVEAAAVKALGRPLDTPLMAQRGDICMVEMPEDNALGWCIGASVACVGKDGLIFIDLKDAKAAWRV